MELIFFLIMILACIVSYFIGVTRTHKNHADAMIDALETTEGEVLKSERHDSASETAKYIEGVRQMMWSYVDALEKRDFVFKKVSLITKEKMRKEAE